MSEQLMAPIKVGIVNDFNLMRKYLTEVISVDLIEVVFTAVDGKDALTKLNFKKPDVILLDLEMPKMDGLTFIDKMIDSGGIKYKVRVCSQC